MLEDEQLGRCGFGCRAWRKRRRPHYDQLLFELIAQGSAAVCFDGLSFYNAAHRTGGTTVSNLTNTPLTSENLQAALTAMKRIPLDNGQPMAIQPTHLLVPPELSFAAKRILNSTYYPEATGTGRPGSMAINPLQGALQIVESSRLPSATEWHILDAGHPVKPFLIQQRIAPEVRALDGSDARRKRRSCAMSICTAVRSRDNAGYGLWQYAYKSTGTGS